MGVWPDTDRCEILGWQLGMSEDSDEKFHAIWQAHRYDTALRRHLKVVRTYRDSQPGAVATLRRDFRSTVTYHLLEQQLPTWERKQL